MKQKSITFYLILFFVSLAAYAEEVVTPALNTLRGVDLASDANTMAITYNFAEEAKLNATQYSVEDGFIEVRFVGSNMTSDKNQISADGAFKEVVTSSADNNTIVSKLYFKDKKIKPLPEDAIKVVSEGNNIIFKIDNSAIVAIKSTELPQKKNANLNEADIPVLTASKNAKAPQEMSSSRVIFGFIVIIVMSVGMIYFSRWYAQRNKKSTDPNRIRILSQHYLGPRKSLAIVRVAGESLLLGITDQNISMIKSLAMLEEEEAETGISSFKNTLMNSNREIVEDDFATQTVTDKITSKLKGMRSI